MESKDKNTRRKFLDKGLKIGLATVIGGVGISKLTSKLNANSKTNSGEMMELMTADGKLIQVDSSEVMEVEHNNDAYCRRFDILMRFYISLNQQP